MNRGQRLAKRFRDFFSEMERGRILLLGIIACVMLYQRISSYIVFLYSHMIVDPDIQLGFFHPRFFFYILALFVLGAYLVRVYWKMKECRETMTPMHWRELTFISLVLALLILPATIVAILDFPDYPPGPDYGSGTFTIAVYYQKILTIADFCIYVILSLISWRMYRKRVCTDPVHLALGRVLALTMIALVVVSEHLISSFGRLRSHQIDPPIRDPIEFYDIMDPYWFYLYAVILCIVIIWLFITLRRMRAEGSVINRGQWQELAVISIGLLLISLPWFLDLLDYYIQHGFEQIIETDPQDSFYAKIIPSFYSFLSLLYSILVFLVLSVIALLKYRRIEQ